MSGIGPLADSERQRLKDLAGREVGRVSGRIRMVLLASRGYSVAQIASRRKETWGCGTALDRSGRARRTRPPVR